jgi:hypothetical protein
VAAKGASRLCFTLLNEKVISAMNGHDWRAIIYGIHAGIASITLHNLGPMLRLLISRFLTNFYGAKIGDFLKNHYCDYFFCKLIFIKIKKTPNLSSKMVLEIVTLTAVEIFL